MRRVGLLLLAVGLLASCGGGVADTPDTPEVEGSWEFAEGTADGTALPVPDSAVATLEIGPDRLHGVSFCNRFFSGYRLDGDEIEIDALASTMMACTPDVMAAETAFLDALGRVTTVARDESDLVLTGDDVRLRFTPLVPVPDSPLAGTRWVLDTLVDDQTASSTLGDPAVLLLDPDRTVEASTGCQQLTGTWLLEDDTLIIDDLLGSATCGPELADQDAFVTDVLGSGPAVEIEGNQLTLTADDGRGLVYRAEA